MQSPLFISQPMGVWDIYALWYPNTSPWYVDIESPARELKMQLLPRHPAYRDRIPSSPFLESKLQGLVKLTVCELEKWP